MRDRLSALRRRGDDGQALVLVLIFILLITLLAPIVVTQLIGESSAVSNNQDFEAALAAAEAGVQQYRNNLDLYNNYWRYSSTNLPSAPVPADPALAANGWETVANSSPAEAFHYIPANPTTNGNTAMVLLTVTGRAGTRPSNYVYRTIQVQLQSSGVLTNAYYSQYEVEDGAQNTNRVCVTPKGGGTPTCYSVDDPSLPKLVPGQTYWQSLCQYDTWQPNTFVDNYSATVSGIADPYDGGMHYNNSPPASGGISYYGPYRGNNPDNGGGSNSYQTFVNSAGQQFTATDPCSGIFNFTNSESFSGPVYTNDQLWVCGPSNFGGGLTSGIPKGFAYDAGWPTHSGTTSGVNGWIDNGLSDWDGSCGWGGASGPNFHGKLFQDGKESLPPLDTAILRSAQRGGCVYTGPTMIEFVSGGTFNVWSPLTSGSAGAGCGTFSATSPWQTGLSIPAAGLVLYVQNAPAGTTIPPLSDYEPSGPNTSSNPAGALPAGATCLNPWKPYTPFGSQCSQATEGDAIIEGEVQGEVTVGAAANIVISRDLSYQCAGGPSAQASLSYPGLPATCAATGHQDIVGLAANGDVVISKPGVECAASTLPPSPARAPGSSSSCNDDQVPNQTEPYEWPAITSSANPNGLCPDNGSEASPTIANVVPDCELANPVMDAAIVALQGSLADEDWIMGASSSCGGNGCVGPTGYAFLWGTDVGLFRGPFGCGGCNGVATGYSKRLNYDSRLTYLTPPDMLSIADLQWSPTTLVSCGDINDSGASASADGNAGAAICPGIGGIN